MGFLKFPKTAKAGLRKAMVISVLSAGVAGTFLVVKLGFNRSADNTCDAENVQAYEDVRTGANAIYSDGGDDVKPRRNKNNCSVRSFYNNASLLQDSVITTPEEDAVIACKKKHKRDCEYAADSVVLQRRSSFSEDEVIACKKQRRKDCESVYVP